MRLTVLDLTRLLPGPYATHLLGEMGARVIRIEDPVHGDDMREFPFPLQDGMSAYFHAVNRGKQSVAIDLKKSPEILLKLAEHADVIIEGFRPGVMDRLGVGYDAISKRNPMMIYCSLSGYGQTGEYRNRAGHDINYVGLTGLLDLNRGQDGKPAMAALQIADVAGSVFVVSRVLQGVIERAERGFGERIDVDMISGTASLMKFTAAPAVLAGRTVTWDDLLLNGQAPCYNLYPTADGRWLSVGNLEAKFWQNFCRVAEREEWIPRQFDKELRCELAEFFRTKPQADWMRMFSSVDTCIEPVRTLNEAARRGLFQYPEAPAPKLGEHTRQVLGEFGIP